MKPSELEFFSKQYPARALVDAKTGQPTGSVITCPARVHYLQIDKAYSNPKYPNKGPEFSVTLILPSAADLGPLQAEFQRTAQAHFGAALTGLHEVKGSDAPIPLHKLLNKPWKSQLKNKGKAGYTEDGSGYFIRASSKFAPQVFGRDRSRIANDSIELYNGMWVLAVLNVYAYPKDLKKVMNENPVAGVNFGLSQLQKIADDSVLPTGGGSPDAFDVITHGSAPSGAAGAVMSTDLPVWT